MSGQMILYKDRETMAYIRTNPPPCFLPGTLVEVPSFEFGTRRFLPMNTLCENDEVITEDNRVVTIKAVVSIPLSTSAMCPLDDDLYVTVSQPVRRIQERLSRRRKPWVKAGDLNTLARIPKDTYGWNLILNDGGSMIRTQKWECVILGHGIADNDVTADQYWGSQAVVWDLVG